MKNLYGFDKEIENKLDEIVSTKGHDDAAAKMDAMDIDPYTDSMGDMLLKLIGYVTDIPMEIFRKKVIDLTIGDIQLLEDLEESMRIYSEVD